MVLYKKIKTKQCLNVELFCSIDWTNGFRRKRGLSFYRLPEAKEKCSKWTSAVQGDNGFRLLKQKCVVAIWCESYSRLQLACNLLDLISDGTFQNFAENLCTFQQPETTDCPLWRPADWIQTTSSRLCFPPSMAATPIGSCHSTLIRHWGRGLLQC